MKTQWLVGIDNGQGYSAHQIAWLQACDTEDEAKDIQATVNEYLVAIGPLCEEYEDFSHIPWPLDCDKVEIDPWSGYRPKAVVLKIPETSL